MSSHSHHSRSHGGHTHSHSHGHTHNGHGGHAPHGGATNMILVDSSPRDIDSDDGGM